MCVSSSSQVSLEVCHVFLDNQTLLEVKAAGSQTR